MLLSIYLPVLWLIFLLIISTGAFLPDTSFLAHTLYAILGLFSYGYCILTWVRYSNRPFSLFLVFVLYMFFSHLGQALLYSLGVTDTILSLYNWCLEVSVTKMLRFHMLCPAALNIGITFYFLRHYSTVSLQEQINSYSENSNHQCAKQNLGLDVLLFSSLLFALYSSLQFWQIRQSLSYADFYEISASTGSMFKSLSTLLTITLGLVYVFISRYQKIIYASWILIALIYLIGGSRGSAITYVGALLVSVPITHSSYFIGNKKYIWIFLAFVAFSFLSVISSNRTGTVGADALVSDQSIVDNAIGTMSEMGGSALPSVLSMEACDSGVLPHYQTNLFFALACFLPADMVEFLTGMQNVQLARVITDYAGSSRSGLGYSCVAESYVNYGCYGWIWFILYGYVIVALECAAYRLIQQSSYFTASLYIYILSSALFYARAPIYYVQGAVRTCFYLYIVYTLFKLFRSAD